MIRVLAECVNGLMLAENVCPVTGEYKKPGFRVSDEALEIYPGACSAVDSILKAFEMLDNGNRTAFNGDNERKRIFGPILCQIKAAKNAEMCYPGDGVKPYLSYSYSVRGGRIKASVFGSSNYDRGKNICVLAEFKIRKTLKGEEYPYFRFQKVEGSVVSDVKLGIRLDNPSLDVFEFVNNLPKEVVDHYVGGENGQSRYLYFAVGFSYI